MYPRAALTLAILFLPLAAFALEAGFPNQSVWLSNTQPTVGDKVQIYAVVYNGTDGAVQGDLTFIVDEKTHESKSVVLKAGESIIMNSLWTASVGDHSFSARFAEAGKESSATKMSTSITATVSAPPTATEQAITQAKDVGTKVADTAVPIITNVAQKVFATTESIRNASIDYLEEKVAAQTPKSSATPSVLGTTTASQVEGFKKEVSVESAKGLLSTITQTASVAALFTLRSLWLFYPILVIFLIFVSRWLYKWVTKPRF